MGKYINFLVENAIKITYKISNKTILTEYAGNVFHEIMTVKMFIGCEESAIYKEVDKRYRKCWGYNHNFVNCVKS